MQKTKEQKNEWKKTKRLATGTLSSMLVGLIVWMGSAALNLLVTLTASRPCQNTECQSQSEKILANSSRSESSRRKEKVKN